MIPISFHKYGDYTRIGDSFNEHLIFNNMVCPNCMAIDTMGYIHNESYCHVCHAGGASDPDKYIVYATVMYGIKKVVIIYLHEDTFNEYNQEKLKRLIGQHILSKL